MGVDERLLPFERGRERDRDYRAREQARRLRTARECLCVCVSAKKGCICSARGDREKESMMCM